jgi:glutamine phosphoribosylpyrophosphate amidotransferase
MQKPRPVADSVLQVADGEPAPVIIPIPESAAHATLGFYEESQRMGRPCTMDLGFFRNPYVGRSFISPSQELRDLKVCHQHAPCTLIVTSLWLLCNTVLAPHMYTVFIIHRFEY